MLHSRLAPAAMLIALVAAACGGNPVPSLVAQALPDGPQTASDAEGRFRLDFALPQRRFTEADDIKGIATLSMFGPGAGTIAASGGGPIGFGIAEVEGTRVMGPASSADCASFEIVNGSPITSGIKKSGGWSGEDRNAAFYEAFFTDREELHLPAGAWDITAYASFSEGDCGPSPHELSAPIRIEVVPGP
jgi:hypothetical protein